MHIVFLTHIFPEDGSATTGAGNYIANIARIMKQRGHRVTIITEAEEKEIICYNGIELRKIRATRGFKNDGRPMPVYKKFLKNIWRSIWYNWEVRKVDNENKVDIVQSVNSFAIPMLRRKNIPYVVRISEFMPLWNQTAKREYKLSQNIDKYHKDEKLDFIAIKRADKVIAPSNLIKDYVHRETGKEILIIESPVMDEVNFERSICEEGLLREQYWITFGLMSYRKEIHVVAEIIDDLLDKYPLMKYVIVGKDKEILHENQFIKASDFFKLHIHRNLDRFVFLDEISDRNRLFHIVRNSYACILPTRADNLPNTVLESMAMGRIVISTTCARGTSVEQLITDGYNGFLAPVDDVKGLYQKVIDVMQLSVREKAEIENRAKDRVKNLTPEEVYKKMIKVYEKTIADFGGNRK